MFLRIVERETRKVLRLPVSALFRHDDGWAVFVVSQAVVRRVPVEIGRRNGLMAEVRGGIDEGQRVVTHPGAALTDGARVVERPACRGGGGQRSGPPAGQQRAGPAPPEAPASCR